MPPIFWSRRTRVWRQGRRGLENSTESVELGAQEALKFLESGAQIRTGRSAGWDGGQGGLAALKQGEMRGGVVSGGELNLNATRDLAGLAYEGMRGNRGDLVVLQPLKDAALEVTAALGAVLVNGAAAVVQKGAGLGEVGVFFSAAQLHAEG